MKRKKLQGVEVEDKHIQFLLRGPKKLGEENPVDWLPEAQWAACCALGELEEFSKFPSDLVEAAPRFKEWFNHVSPETEKLPLDWAGLDRSPFLKMLVVRSLRPDRMTSMLSSYVGSVLPNGTAYIECDSTKNFLEVVDESIGDSTTVTPLYFILSPGADVVSDLDKLAAKYGFNKGAEYHNVSMGQGQDVIAMEYLDLAHRNGHWVILNNVHLMPRWLIELEKKLDTFAAEGSNEKFRLFLTSDPSKAIPIGLLNRCIKLTNEPPSGLKANLKRAVSFFSKDYIEELDSKTKSILFGLCYFHAVLIERKLYGPLGFNMMYPFAIGDLRDSAVCLSNYMENATGGKIPWEDLKYLFGEIMYGGHIVNDFDRTLANGYLDSIMKEELLDESEMYPYAGDEKETFKAPAPCSSDKQIEHIDLEMKNDTPIAFGLHPNAEIDFRTKQSDTMFETIMEMQPRDGGGGGDGLSPQHVAENTLNDILERFGEKKFDTEEISRSLDEVGPFQNVFIQECSAMNVLLTEIKRSLAELNLGFAGELTMSDAMEGLMNNLFLDKVPDKWKKLSWPTLRTLPAWLVDLQKRFQQLEEWTANPADVPKVTWLSGLINPQSFLTAIAQVAAQRNKWELDKLVVNTEVTKRQLEEVDAPSRDGALIYGLYLQGGRWDMQNGVIDKSKPKEMFSPMPVMNCKAVSAEKAEAAGIYQCPCYKTVQRGPTYIFQAQLKTKSPAARWVLAGVALVADIL
jgi:dynein heavy chain